MFDCPICYEIYESDDDDSTALECPTCHQRICQGCSRSIRQSATVASACPFCRNTWIPKPLTTPASETRATETLAEWRRRLRLSRQLTQWVVAPAVTAADPFRPDSTAGIVAAAQVVLMGIWFWAHA